MCSYLFISYKNVVLWQYFVKSGPHNKIKNVISIGKMLMDCIHMGIICLKRSRNLMLLSYKSRDNKIEKLLCLKSNPAYL